MAKTLQPSHTSPQHIRHRDTGQQIRHRDTVDTETRGNRFDTETRDNTFDVAGHDWCPYTQFSRISGASGSSSVCRYASGAGRRLCVCMDTCHPVVCVRRRSPAVCMHVYMSSSGMRPAQSAHVIYRIPIYVSVHDIYRYMRHISYTNICIGIRYISVYTSQIVYRYMYRYTTYIGICVIYRVPIYALVCVRRQSRNLQDPAVRSSASSVHGVNNLNKQAVM